MRGGFLDAVMPAVTSLGNGGLVWIAVALILTAVKKYRVAGIAVLIALILNLLIGNVILKPLIARVRPCDINTAVKLLIPRPTDYSFPSGHTLSSFAAATVIFLRDKRFGTAALILASLIAFSRLYLYVHYPTDVLAGIVIGIAIGFFSYYATDKITKKILGGK